MVWQRRGNDLILTRVDFHHCHRTIRTIGGRFTDLEFSLIINTTYWFTYFYIYQFLDPENIRTSVVTDVWRSGKRNTTYSTSCCLFPCASWATSGHSGSRGLRERVIRAFDVWPTQDQGSERPTRVPVREIQETRSPRNLCLLWMRLTGVCGRHTDSTAFRDCHKLVIFSKVFPFYLLKIFIYVSSVVCGFWRE